MKEILHAEAQVQGVNNGNFSLQAPIMTQIPFRINGEDKNIQDKKSMPKLPPMMII
jgi:hypothetical protein